MAELTNEIKEQIKKRRTFAIISHPGGGEDDSDREAFFSTEERLIRQEVLRVKRAGEACSI